MYWWYHSVILLVVGFVSIFMPAHAQELGVEGNAGWQGMRYPLQNGQSGAVPGGSLGLNYTFPLNGQVGLLTGLSCGLYRTRATLQDGTAFTSGQVDNSGSAFEYKVRFTGYEENQRFFAASIPLLLQYHPSGPGVQWYFDAGAKVVIPFNTSVQVAAKQLALSGYYPDFNIDVSNLPQHGFGTINGWNARATAKWRPAVALSIGSGLRFGLSPGKCLYAGVYLDYGLTGLKGKSDSMPLVTYSSNGVTRIQAGSVLNQPSTGRVALLSFGIQLRLGFGAARSKPPAQSETKIIFQTKPVMDTLSDEQHELMERAVVFGLLGVTVVPESQKRHLDELAGIMKKYPSVRISLTGHTCGSDTEVEDRKVGDERARSVAQYLQFRGIDPARMDVSAARESDVFEPFNPPANYQSRRVVIRVE